MGNSNGKITSPVGLAGDIYTVLGLSPQNGKYDVAYPCKDTEKKINKWARNKPIKHTNVGILTDAQRIEKNFGLVAPQSFVDSPDDLKCSAWTYAPPSGGASEPFRMHDFNGYNHKSVVPIRLRNYEFTYDKKYPSDLKFFAYFKVKTLTSGEVSYGDTTNVEIGLDELRPAIDINYNFPSRIYWGLAYNRNGNILVANSENNLDKSANGASVSPDVVDLSKWTIGDMIKNASPGTTFELTPIINPVSDGSVIPTTKNGNISSYAVCFPEGTKLKIKVISSQTIMYSYAASGNISIYGDVDGMDKVGAFGYQYNSGSLLIRGTYFELWLEAEYTIQNKTNYAYTVQAWLFSLDFSSFPTDDGKNLGRIECESVKIAGDSYLSSVDIPANSTKTVFFKTKTTASAIQSAFYNESQYQGVISLYDNSSHGTLARATYNIPTSKTY